jgi:hypothetical protein
VGSWILVAVGTVVELVRVTVGGRRSARVQGSTNARTVDLVYGRYVLVRPEVQTADDASRRRRYGVAARRAPRVSDAVGDPWGSVNVVVLRSAGSGLVGREPGALGAVVLVVRWVTGRRSPCGTGPVRQLLVFLLV